MSSFTYHSLNDFFLNFICFHVLHWIRHKMSTIFVMLKMFSCADLFSRLLCWSIYWWIMWFLCGFGYIAKITTGWISRQWLEFVSAVREMSGKSQGTFFCQPCGNPDITGPLWWGFTTHRWVPITEMINDIPLPRRISLHISLWELISLW